jgi:hypothetical protein
MELSKPQSQYESPLQLQFHISVWKYAVHYFSSLQNIIIPDRTLEFGFGNI